MGRSVAQRSSYRRHRRRQHRGEPLFRDGASASESARPHQRRRAMPTGEMLTLAMSNWFTLVAHAQREPTSGAAMSDEIVVDAISAAIGGYPRLTTSQSPRHGALAALALLIIGAILLLPGLCAVFFARDMLTNPNVVLGGLILLYHKFHLWLLRMRRTQCAHSAGICEVCLQSRRPVRDGSWQSSWGRDAAAGSGAPRGR